MDESKDRLSLDRPATYQITVPGCLDDRWAEWDDRMTVTVEGEAADSPLTTLTGAVDQAGLQGLLRRLYSLGLPLLSVHCLEAGPAGRPQISK